MNLKKLLRPTLLRKFLVAFLVVSLVPLIIAEYYTLKESEKELLSKLNEEYYGTVSQVQRTVDEIFIKRWLSSLHALAQYLTDNPYLNQETLVALLNGNLNQTEELLLLAYRPADTDQPLYFMKNEKVNELFQKDGDAVAQLFQLPVTPQGTPQEGVLAPLFLSKSQRYFLPIEFSVALGRPTKGVLRGVYDIGAILNYIAATNPGEHRELYIVDREGKILFRNQNARFAADTLLTYPIVDKFKLSLGGTARAAQVEPFVFENEQYLGNYAKSRYIEWGIIIVDRASFAYALLNQLKRNILFWVIIAVLLTLAFSTFFARSFSNSIRYLADLSRKIGGGDFNVVVNVPQRDELGQLGHSLQEMALSLKDAVRVKEELFTIQQEVKIASRIQQSILPLNLPEIKGLTIAAKYIPMAGVAGDFYDFHVINESKIGVLVADVSGHGIPAALIGAMVKVAFSQQIGVADQPAEVLKRMNDTLYGKTEDQFLTACDVLIDVKKHSLAIADAGHPPLFIWRRQSREIVAVKPTGIVIGFMPDIEFPTLEAKLMKGDRLVLYTDGVTEAPNPQGELYGEDRFRQLIETAADMPPGEFIDLLVSHLTEWGGRKESFEDDVTLVVVDIG